MQYNTIFYDTTQWNTIQYEMIWYNTMRYDMWYDTMWCITIQYDILWCDTSYDTTQYFIKQCNVIQCKMILYEPIWYDTVWNEMICCIRYGMIWYENISLWPQWPYNTTQAQSTLIYLIAQYLSNFFSTTCSPGCTVGNITHVTISDASFPFGYDSTQFDLCLDVPVVKDNLNTITEKVDDNDFQIVILAKLNQVNAVYQVTSLIICIWFMTHTASQHLYK